MGVLLHSDTGDGAEIMSARKYTEFEIGRRVNVSSTGHYSFHVHIKGYKTRWLGWDGHGTFWTQSSYPHFPAYVMTALRACLLERLKAADTVFYENDQYGGSRTTDLRYHDPELIQSWIERLEATQQAIEGKVS